ncbi:MAG TPA: response regulator transcription factor [Actinomycetota bacterium]|nr:response regulator transcription factor [Actinomycetota bacterium]
MASTDPISVFIVDDHEMLRDGLKEALAPEDDIRVVGESSQVEGTTDLIVELDPVVAVIDVRLPDGSGVHLCRDVQSLDVATRCLMFTSATGEEPLYQSILAGASGYLLKNASRQEIVSAIRALAAGQSMIDPAVAGSVLERLRQHERIGLEDLTVQEHEVLSLLGEGLTNAQIATRLHLADQTVKNYVSHVLTKLDLTRTQSALFSAKAKRDEEESG